MSESWITNRPVGAAAWDWLRARSASIDQARADIAAAPEVQSPLGARLQNSLPARLARQFTPVVEQAAPIVGADTSLAPLAQVFGKAAMPAAASARAAVAMAPQALPVSLEALPQRLPMPQVPLTFGQAIKLLSVMRAPTQAELAQQELYGLGKVNLARRLAYAKGLTDPEKQAKERRAAETEAMETLKTLGLSGSSLSALLRAQALGAGVQPEE